MHIPGNRQNFNRVQTYIGQSEWLADDNGCFELDSDLDDSSPENITDDMG